MATALVLFRYEMSEWEFVKKKEKPKKLTCNYCVEILELIRELSLFPFIDVGFLLDWVAVSNLFPVFQLPQ